MRSLFASNRMALPPLAPILRAKVVLTALALAAAAVLVAVGSWPLKVLVVLAFVRGLFASDLIAMRNAPRPRRAARGPPTASAGRSAGRVRARQLLAASERGATGPVHVAA